MTRLAAFATLVALDHEAGTVLAAERAAAALHTADREPVIALRLSPAVEADSCLDSPEGRARHRLTKAGARYSGTMSAWRGFRSHAEVMAADADSAGSRRAFAALLTRIDRALDGADMHCGDDSCAPCSEMFGDPNGAQAAAERAAAMLRDDRVRLARAMVADADIRGCIALVQDCDPAVRLDVRAPSRVIRDRASDLAAMLVRADMWRIDDLAALLSVQP